MSATIHTVSKASQQTHPKFEASWFWRLLPAGMRRRWWLFRIFDLIARYWPVPGVRKGLLLVRMDGIGDMILFRQTLDHYSEVFKIPNSEIIVLGCNSWAAVAKDLFEDYRLMLIDAHAYARQPFYRFKISLMVRRLNVQTTVCDSYFRRAMMADSLVWMSAAKKSIVSLPFINEPPRTEFTYYLSQVDLIIDTGSYPTHEIIRHYNFLSAISGKEYLPIAPSVSWKAAVKVFPLDSPYIVLSPGSNEHGRRWPYENYISIAKVLHDRGYNVVIVGSIGEYGNSSSKNFTIDSSVTDLAGKTRLPELIDILKNAAGTISNDTGPAHLSIALGTPTVVIVGGGHFGSFVPYPKNIIPDHARFIYEKMSCYHCFWRCHKRSNKYEVFPCISAVSEKRVVDSVMELIA